MRPEDLHVEPAISLPFALLPLFALLAGFALVVMGVVSTGERRKHRLTSAGILIVILGAAGTASVISDQTIRDTRGAIISDWVESHGIQISEEPALSVADQILGQEDTTVSFNTTMDGAPVSVQVMKKPDGSYGLFYTDLKALEPKELARPGTQPQEKLK